MKCLVCFLVKLKKKYQFVFRSICQESGEEKRPSYVKGDKCFFLSELFLLKVHPLPL